MMEEKYIPGICCKVENCVYNNGHCHCTANEIDVEKCGCDHDNSETKCGTFREV